MLQLEEACIILRQQRNKKQKIAIYSGIRRECYQFFSQTFYLEYFEISIFYEQYVIITPPIYDTCYKKFRRMQFFRKHSIAVFHGRNGRRVSMKSTVVKSNRGGKNTRLIRRGWPTALSAL